MIGLDGALYHKWQIRQLIVASGLTIGILWGLDRSLAIL